MEDEGKGIILGIRQTTLPQGRQTALTPRSLLTYGALIIPSVIADPDTGTTFTRAIKIHDKNGPSIRHGWVEIAMRRT